MDGGIGLVSPRMLVLMTSDHNLVQARQLRESMARVIGNAAAKADRLGLADVAAILRQAVDAAMRDAERHRDPDRQDVR